MVKISLEEKTRAYEILNKYDGPNGYIQKLRNDVYHYKKVLNEFHVNFIKDNYGFEPRYIGKIVKVTEWWGKKKQEELNLDFIPKVIEVGWYMGQSMGMVVFYARFKKSQEHGMLVISSQEAFITNFWMENYSDISIDFSRYNTNERVLKPHQEEAVKFLVSRKKCILADSMGLGKTTSAIVGSLVGGYKHVLIICPQSVKKTWQEELSYYIPEEDITIVSGSKWDDRKYTIINFDILDNFYTIPKQTIKQKSISLNEEGDVVTEYNDKEIVSRSRKIINSAMQNSQLFQAKYDLIIIDEAHKLSNNTSGRFKIISDLIRRSKPIGIFELTGTMITNSAKNLYNLLKVIDVPVTRDWNKYMGRYCGTKSYYQKKERDAYTAMFCKIINKPNWYALNDKEKEDLNEFLEKKHCNKYYVQGEDQNMDELQEIIKPYYIRRVKEDLEGMVKKTVKCIHYEMSKEEQKSYDELWDKYLELQDDKDKTEQNRQLIEISLMRQWLADKMIDKTTYIVNKCIESGHKVVVFCSFDNEINKFREIFGNKCVYHNGKLSEKQKKEAVEKFQGDDNIKVFIGNIVSSGVGLTLTSANIVVFNNFAFVPSENLQCEDRVVRIGQTKPCTIYYQSFNGTYFDKMLQIVNKKQNVIDKIVVTEKEK